MNNIDYEEFYENKLKEIDDMQKKLMIGLCIGTSVVLIGTAISSLSKNKVTDAHEYGNRPQAEYTTEDMRTR
ncbi:MAG: hypothetical protein IKP76_02350 [Bacilli bacterium]|nr:hypothetical protein [Bacilli bacterium]